MIAIIFLLLVVLFLLFFNLGKDEFIASLKEEIAYREKVDQTQNAMIDLYAEQVRGLKEVRTHTDLILVLKDRLLQLKDEELQSLRNQLNQPIHLTGLQPEDIDSEFKCMVCGKPGAWLCWDCEPKTEGGVLGPKELKEIAEHVLDPNAEEI